MWHSWSLTGNGPDVQTAGNEDVVALIGPLPGDDRVKEKRAGIPPRHSDTEITLQATLLQAASFRSMRQLRLHFLTILVFLMEFEN